MTETDREWPDWMDASERVRHVALTRTEPRNAGWIADEANVSRDTAVKYLTRLVDRGDLEVEETGHGDAYRPDRVTQFLDEVRQFAETYSRGELTQELDEIADEIDGWKVDYEVDSLVELRQSIGRDDLDGDERRDRLAVIGEWEYDIEMREAIQLAISLKRSLSRVDADPIAETGTIAQEG
ncbi:hypothetical protein Halru_0600 [Halovivax ruber XH-70]|uniref:Sugar-specific transcriptional regulator TrmB n=1 Tax=Halovivax ruber (strain DSM 18193 / JCM 13892 / XH-70) TaxID=797302 RepID=L0I942_HALRX|nr:hypothetical protein [Halovivax ruber]AGB15229.1 hypothetical protein Halru_0600 [Halovivax ruber XH-70]